MLTGFVCRACGSSQADTILDFGEVPLANAFVSLVESTAADEFRAPLCLVMCRHCRLLQIKDEVDRDRLYRNYLWMTATSASARKHAVNLSCKLKRRYGNARHDGRAPFLVEIASNDGTFLEAFKDAGFEILGVDPSNFADDASARGLTSIRDFFGEELAIQIAADYDHADLIVARNVLGHSSELKDLVKGLKVLLADRGTLILEMPYAYKMRAELQYDYIFHEHLSYFSVQSLHSLLAEFDLRIVDIDFVHMNGGSLLCEVAHADDSRASCDQPLLAFERFIELNKPGGWKSFSDDVERQRETLLTCLGRLQAKGKRIAAYGAAARFMTLLNYCRLSRDDLVAIGDANERKQGLLCPGVRIPVVAPSELVDLKPDYILIGAMNFKDEIIDSLTNDYGYRGGFITPSPLPEIID